MDVKDHVEFLREHSYVEYMGVTYKLDYIIWSPHDYAYIVGIADSDTGDRHQPLFLTPWGIRALNPGDMYQSPLYKALTRDVE